LNGRLNFMHLINTEEDAVHSLIAALTRHLGVGAWLGGRVRVATDMTFLTDYGDSGPPCGAPTRREPGGRSRPRTGEAS
jgi:hypothetical protein